VSDGTTKQVLIIATALLIMPDAAYARPRAVPSQSALRALHAEQAQQHYPAPVLPFDVAETEPEPDDSLAGHCRSL
jgi:hypothetical protein